MYLSLVCRLRTIFGVLDVVSNFGVLQLNPDLFEPELKVIRNASYLNHAMLLMEYEVVAKFLQCMRLFGPNMTAACNSLIAACEHFLFVKQLQNGSWCKVNGSAPEQYKATATCAKYVSGLYEYANSVRSSVRERLTDCY